MLNFDITGMVEDISQIYFLPCLWLCSSLELLVHDKKLVLVDSFSSCNVIVQIS